MIGIIKPGTIHGGFYLDYMVKCEGHEFEFTTQIGESWSHRLDVVQLVGGES